MRCSVRYVCSMGGIDLPSVCVQVGRSIIIFNAGLALGGYDRAWILTLINR